MIVPLLLGTGTLILSMGIQVFSVVAMVRQLLRFHQQDHNDYNFKSSVWILSIILLVLFAGNLIQILIWAILFMLVGEFSEIATAFYHSAVNFASLGYGDIVMSEQWRLLGALEACNGVLMFGLTSGTLMTVMTWIFSHRKEELLKNRNTGEQAEL